MSVTLQPKPSSSHQSSVTLATIELPPCHETKAEEGKGLGAQKGPLLQSFVPLRTSKLFTERLHCGLNCRAAPCACAGAGSGRYVVESGEIAEAPTIRLRVIWELVHVRAAAEIFPELDMADIEVNEVKAKGGVCERLVHHRYRTQYTHKQLRCINGLQTHAHPTDSRTQASRAGRPSSSSPLPVVAVSRGQKVLS